MSADTVAAEAVDILPVTARALPVGLLVDELEA